MPKFFSSSSSSTWDNPFGTAVFTYDADGNVETKTVGSTVLTYTYNPDGSIDEITDGTHTKSFSYTVGGDIDTITYS